MLEGCSTCRGDARLCPSRTACQQPEMAGRRPRTFQPDFGIQRHRRPSLFRRLAAFLRSWR